MVSTATLLSGTQSASLNTGAPALLPLWPASPRHSAQFYTGLPALRLVDPKTVEDVAMNSPQRTRAWPLLEWLGCTVRLDTGTPHLPAGRLHDLERTLAGQTPERRPRILAAIAEACRTTPTSIEATDLALLEAMGLDMPACILLALARDVSEPLSVDAVQVVSPDGNLQAWLYPTRSGSATDSEHGIKGGRHRKLDISTATVGDGAFWTHGTLNVQGLPESVAASLPGRPLSDLIGHPALDRLGLTITDARDGDEMHVVRTDFEARYIPIEQVMERYATG